MKSIVGIATALLIAAAAGCGPPSPTTTPAPSATRPAPDSFTVSMQTTRGPVMLMIHRDWAPVGVDRLYALLRDHYYDSAAVYRVVPKFVVQFGLAAKPQVTAAWRRQTLIDDAVRQSNARGTVTFARGGRDSRTTQLFINLADNARLDTANVFGFPPIGRVISGMEFVDQFNAEYSRSTPRQDSIVASGNAYLAREYPRLDYVLRMRIEQEWPPARR